MNFDHKVINGVDVVAMEEAIDLYSTPPIKKFLKSLADNKNKKIVLSLEKVNFLDSSGLGMLVNLFYECKQKGVGIKLAAVSSEVSKIITLAKKKENFEFYPTITDAIESFR